MNISLTEEYDGLDMAGKQRRVATAIQSILRDDVEVECGHCGYCQAEILLNFDTEGLHGNKLLKLTIREKETEQETETYIRKAVRYKAPFLLNDEALLEWAKDEVRARKFETILAGRK